MPYDFYQSDKRIEFFRQLTQQNPTPQFLKTMNMLHGTPGTIPKGIQQALDASEQTQQPTEEETTKNGKKNRSKQ